LRKYCRRSKSVNGIVATDAAAEMPPPGACTGSGRTTMGGGWSSSMLENIFLFYFIFGLKRNLKRKKSIFNWEKIFIL
jgi:hypothetical protein